MAGKRVTAGKIVKSEAVLPAFPEEEARRAFAAACGADMARVRAVLRAVLAAPPQVLLLEGGSEAARMALARWWAASFHCEFPEDQRPCLRCHACLHIGAGTHRDVWAYDGRISNKEDEASPGPVRAFNMDNIRVLKSRLGSAPHGSGRRAVLLSGLDQTRDEAANALLKVLEEPSPHTVFVLLTPQREQLLPTLISRSWTLTLPWPTTGDIDAALLPWLEDLATFLECGRGWLDRTAPKGAVDAPLAGQLLLGCQKELTAALAGAPARPLARHFAALDDGGRAAAGDMLARAQEALHYAVNPARVLDWLAVRLYGVRHPS